MPSDQKSADILFAEAEDNVVVIKVVGRGNFNLSPKLKKITDNLNEEQGSRKFIIDIEECPTLDSTFMGVMASIAINQSQHQDTKTAVLNPNPTTIRQLGTLGLSYLLDIYADPGELNAPEAVEFKSLPNSPQSRFEQIVHMIESHQTLVDAHSGNEIKFRAVLTDLEQSLEQEKAKREQQGDDEE